MCGKKRLADGVKEEIINILKKSELLNTGEEALKFLQEMKVNFYFIKNFKKGF